MLHKLFPLPGYLDNQCGEFLELWMDYHGFRELPDLIKYCTTIGTSTLLILESKPLLLAEPTSVSTKPSAPHAEASCSVLVFSDTVDRNSPKV